MSKIILGMSEVKFYDAKTGEEILPMDLDDIKEDVQKEEELEKTTQTNWILCSKNYVLVAVNTMKDMMDIMN